MGNGVSSGSSPGTGTAAKLIRLDGELQEFFYPMKISNLKTTTSDSFVCNSDDMDFGGFVSAIKGEEELRPGQLYFELPLTWLTRRLQAEDMASLAVKASAALAMKDHGRCGCYYAGRKRVDPLAFLNEEFIRVKKDGSVCETQILKKKRADIAGGVGNPRTKNFATKLSVILEE